MPVDRSKLLDFLKVIDSELDRRITVLAVGGTAMTLLRIKASTRDVDLTIPSNDYQAFKRVLKRIPHGFKIHCWKNSLVFSQILPDDYLARSFTIKAGMKDLTLKALHPLDIVVTKIGRLDDRDWEDIADCIKRCKLRRGQIIRRARQVQYVGREENYEITLSAVIRRFFPK